MAEVSLDDVSKAFGTQNAVANVSFTVEPGHLVALLGPSGCGKSTTLRLIAGLEDTTGGAIRIGGRDVTHAAPAERGVSMVFQSYALFPHLTVAQNILFGLEVRKVPKAERLKRLDKAAGILGLTQLLGRKPSQLSGGQQQRVAIARALAPHPGILFADEPTGNLDPETSRIIVRLLSDINQEGTTVVVATHDEEFIDELGGRLLALDHGVLTVHHKAA